MGLKVLNSTGKNSSVVAGGGEQYVSGTPCIAGHYYYDNDMNRYKCIKDTDGTIPLTNTTYFEPLSIDDEIGDITNIDINGLENKRTLKATILVASGWTGGVYSFESLYPSTQYDLEQIQPTGNADQVKAWGAATVIGSPEGNTIKCLGKVPTVDIPVMFYVRDKSELEPVEPTGGIGKTLTVDIRTDDGGSLSDLSVAVTSEEQNYKGKTYPRLTQSITAPGTGNYDFNVLPNAEVTVDLGKVSGYSAPASESFTITGNMSVPFIYTKLIGWTAAELNAMTDGNGSTIATFSSLADVNTFIDNNVFGDGYFSKENTGLRVGNVIKINDGTYNKDWYIMGFDTEIGKGDTPNTRSHITLIPKTNLTTSMIHSSNADCNGYANSNTLYATTIPSVVTHLDSVLGDHLLTRRVKLTNATSSGTSPRGYMASGNGYYSVKANLLSQMQVFGTVDNSFGNAYDTGDDTEQLPGFKTGKVAIKTGSWYWLRDVYGYDSSSSYYSFGIVNAVGSLDYSNVNYSGGGVRPLITVG